MSVRRVGISDRWYNAGAHVGQSRLFSFGVTVGGGDGNGSTPGNTTAPAFTVPAGLAAGDVICGVVLTMTTGATTVTATSGWTVTAYSTTGSFNNAGATYYGALTSTDITNGTYSPFTFDTARTVYVFWSAFRGHSVVDAGGTAVNASSMAMGGFPSAVIGDLGVDMVVSALALSAWTVPSPYQTYRYTGTPGSLGQSAAYRVTSNSIADRTYTYGSSQYVRGARFLLRPV